MKFVSIKKKIKFCSENFVISETIKTFTFKFWQERLLRAKGAFKVYLLVVFIISILSENSLSQLTRKILFQLNINNLKLAIKVFELTRLSFWRHKIQPKTVCQHRNDKKAYNE